MARETIERNGYAFKSYPKGMKEFAEEVANELLNKFPNVDVFDLKTIFELEFNFSYTMACCAEEEKRFAED